MYRCGSYIRGDGDFDDTKDRFLPFNDKTGYMIYDLDEEHFYTPTEALVKAKIGDLKGKYSRYTGGLDGFIRNQRDIVLEFLYSNLNDQFPEQGANAEFKVARTAVGRKAIQQAYVAQIRYADYDADDTNENAGNMLSPRAQNIMQRMYRIASRGGVLPVNPDATADNGYRNGY
jgi:hypothetical protein